MILQLSVYLTAIDIDNTSYLTLLHSKAYDFISLCNLA